MGIVKGSTARGRFGFSIVWGSANSPGPRGLHTSIWTSRDPNKKTTTMAIGTDGTGSCDNSELECDNANPQIERLLLFFAVRWTKRILARKVYKDRHMELWVSYM